MKSIVKHFSHILLCLILSCSIASANWWLGGEGDWTDDSKWSLGHVPLPGEQVVIHPDESLVTIPAGAIVNVKSIIVLDETTLIIASSAVVNIDGDGNVEGLSNSGTVINNGAIFVTDVIAYGIISSGPSAMPASIINNGSIELTDVGIGIVCSNVSTMENHGTINISNVNSSNTAGVILNTGSVFTNMAAATMDISDVNGPLSKGFFINVSELHNFGTITIDDVEQDVGLRNNGSTAVLHNEGTLEISNAALEGIHNLDGKLSGNGTWSVGEVLNEGVLAPGNSPGLITLSGDLVHSAAAASYEVEIAGNGGSGQVNGHDRINQEGDLVLGGDLTVTLLDGFVPSAADFYLIMSYTGSLTNTFTNVSLPASMSAFTVDYTTSPGQIFLAGPASSLPVELVYFRGFRQNEEVLLEWQTATELDNRGFEVQRSTGGAEWETVGWVDGRGTTTTLQNYSFTDAHPFCGANYYRLQQYDYNGDSEWSESRVVRFDCKIKEAVLYPNPVEDHLYYNVENVAFVRVYDLHGRLLLYSSTANGRIDISSLSSGWYLVELLGGDQRVAERIMVR